MPLIQQKKKTYIRQVDLLVLLDVVGNLVDSIGHILGGRSTIGSVELDTKVIIGATGVVGSSEKDTTVGLEGSNKGRTSGRGEDGVLAENDVLDAVGSTDTDDNLGSLGRLKLE